MAGNTATRTYTIKKRKIPKVGEIVNYTPDTPSTGYDLSTAKSGYSSAQTIDDKDDPKVWKIMEVDENGNITKLLGIGSKYVRFKGSTGYNNGVYLLNDICKSRYGNASLGATARSLNIEDIESRMNSKGIAARNAFKLGTVQYGTTRKYTSDKAYPAIYAQEKYSGINVSDVADGTQVITGSVDTTAQSKMNPSGKTQNEDVYTAATIDTSKTDATSLTCTQTYYHMSSPSSYFNDSNFYSMIFGTGTNFWLASRCVNCDSKYSYADFGLRRVYRSVLNGNYLFYSFGSSNNDLNRLASAVSLGSGIQVKSGSGTESDPYVIGK